MRNDRINTLPFLSASAFLHRALMGIELMLNAVNINLVAFNRFLNPEVAVGYVFVLLIMVVAAAEVAVGLAIILKNYRERGRSDLSDINWLKW